MKKTYCLFILIITIICSSLPLSAQDKKITTVFLVRHAEKVRDGSRDPELTPAGQKRADELARVLGEVKLSAVYSTPYKRTMNTAKPSAETQSLEIIKIPSLKYEELKIFMDKTLEKYRGGKILMVSHSNIVPALIKIIRREEFEMRKIKYINDSVYDDLFAVSFVERKTAVVTNLKYGKHTPAK